MSDPDPSQEPAPVPPQMPAADPPQAPGPLLPAGRPRKTRYAVTVKQVSPLTPRMVRVVFGGEALAGFQWNGPAAHIKLIFAAADPAAAPAAATDPAAGPGADVAAPAQVMRTYTPRRFDAAARELSVDFVLHGEGPAAAWAAQARIGQSLLVAGPGRSYSVDPQADWLLAAGDESAIPAIATLLEALPARQKALALLETTDITDEFELLPPRPDQEIRWLRRGPDSLRPGAELENHLKSLTFPPGSGRFYVACEADAMRRIRRHLLLERGLDRAHLITRGYWKRGAVDHPDRDYGEDA